MIEEIDLRIGRVLTGKGDGQPPILVATQVTTGACACLTLIGYRLDDPDAIEAFAALGRGDGDEQVAREYAKAALSTAIFPCARHSENGAADRFYADFREGLDGRDPARDDRPLAEVVEELMLVHLLTVVH